MTISRRDILKGIYASSILYPVHSILDRTQALGQVPNKKRALFLYYPDGSIANDFFPAAISQLPYITAPLQSLANQISFIRGLEYKTTGSHEGGARFCFTGQPDLSRLYSIDSYIGDIIGNQSAIKVLRLGVGSGFQTGADKQIAYLKSGAAAVIEDHPRKVFYNLFGGNMNSGDLAAAMNSDKSILDFTMGQVNKLQTRLGALEREKLEIHLDGLRELEKRLESSNNQSCNAQFNNYGINFPESETQYPPTHHRNQLYGNISDMMVDIMVQAFSCGITNVGLLQWSHAVSPTVFNFTGGPNIARGHHDMSHYGGDPNGQIALEFKASQRWHIEQMAKLLTRLQATPGENGSLLSSMAVLGTTEIGDSNLHSFTEIPCFIAGTASGSLRQGQILNQNISYNHLLVTVLNSLGINDGTFGDPTLGAGNISQLMT